MKKLNIGAGSKSKPGYINLDRISFPGVDVVHDLNKFPYPFEDNTFDWIEGQHILEHLPNLLGVMEELYRISKPNGILSFIVPHHASGNYYIDPTHCIRFSYGLLRIFDCKDKLTEVHPWRQTGKYNLELIHWRLHFHPWYLKPIEWFVKKFQGFYDYHLCFIFQPSDLVFKYKVIK